MRTCQAHEAPHHPPAAGTLQYTTCMDSLRGSQIKVSCCWGRGHQLWPRCDFPSAGQQLTSAQPDYHVRCCASTALLSFPQWKTSSRISPLAVTFAVRKRSCGISRTASVWGAEGAWGLPATRGEGGAPHGAAALLKSVLLQAVHSRERPSPNRGLLCSLKF